MQNDDNLPPFCYYTDGEYDYRIERGADNSAAALTKPGAARHGRPALIEGMPGMRVWKLADRPAAPAKITTIDGCSPACVDDGSRTVHGRNVPQPNPWTFACEVYLDNAADFDAASKRLLGADLLAACEQGNAG